MSAKEARGGDGLGAPQTVYRRIGHKGADAIAEGNTIESFVAAVEQGVDMIELDVLRVREGLLVIAHDSQDVLRRRALSLTEAMDAFLEPPLDQVEIDFDLKLPGREAELAGALAGHGLLDRAMVSTMEISSLIKLRRLEPEIRLGWTYPKTRRDWTNYRWAAPGVAAGLMALRRRFPRHLETRAPELGIDAVWAYHQIVSPNLVAAAERVGIEVIAWTVDDPVRMADLLAMGVNGICTNDPRLFPEAERVAGMATAPSESEGPSGDGGEGQPARKRWRRFLRRKDSAEGDEVIAGGSADGDRAPAEVEEVEQKG